MNITPEVRRRADGFCQQYIQIKRGTLEAAEGMVNIAKIYIKKIDTPSIIEDYNKIAKKLELEKYVS